MASESVNMPSGFGGLMRYSEEYASRFPLRPSHVIVFIILIITFRVFLGMFYG